MEGIKKHRANKSMYNMTGSPLKSRKSPVKGKKTSKTIHVLKDKLNNISYPAEKIIGKGTFGVVYQSTDPVSSKKIAIKKVLQDLRYINRELEIMKDLKHPNIISLISSFYLSGTRPNEVFLNLILEYFPETLSSMIKVYSPYQKMPLILVKLYSYQLLRSLLCCDILKICHRDVKPSNLLINSVTHRLVLCDFGSAKKLVNGEPNLAYICSRYYRAPELIYGSTNYNALVDMWSAGCVIAEMILGKPIFSGKNSSDQLIEIIKVLGTATDEEIREINPKYAGIKFPGIRKTPWSRVFCNCYDEQACDLLEKILVYLPSKRINPLQALQHPFFDDLKKEDSRLPNGRQFPSLFDWNEVEINAGIGQILTPEWFKKINIAF